MCILCLCISVAAAFCFLHLGLIATRILVRIQLIVTEEQVKCFVTGISSHSKSQIFLRGLRNIQTIHQGTNKSVIPQSVAINIVFAKQTTTSSTLLSFEIITQEHDFYLQISISYTNSELNDYVQFNMVTDSTATWSL